LLIWWSQRAPNCRRRDRIGRECRWQRPNPSTADASCIGSQRSLAIGQWLRCPSGIDEKISFSQRRRRRHKGRPGKRCPKVNGEAREQAERRHRA
jgi:hypothetical protein